MDIIRRGTLPKAVGIVQEALTKPHWEPLTLAFAKRLDQDGSWSTLPRLSKLNYAKGLQAPLMQHAEDGNVTALLALNALDMEEDSQVFISLVDRINLQKQPRDIRLRIFRHAATMAGTGVLPVKLLDDLTASNQSTSPWTLDELAALLTGTVSLDRKHLSIELVQRCANLIPKGPVMPEVAAAMWMLRKHYDFPRITEIVPDLRPQSLNAMVFLAQADPEFFKSHLNVIERITSSPAEQVIRLCTEGGIWTLISKPEKLVTFLAENQALIAENQIGQICTLIRPPASPNTSTIGYDLLIENCFDVIQKGQIPIPIVPLIRNLAKLPLEEQTVRNIAPHLLTQVLSERDGIKPLSLVAFEEFNEKHCGDELTTLFYRIDVSSFSIDETCLSLSVATKFIRRMVPATSEIGALLSVPWRERFFATHCERILKLYNAELLFRPDHWHIVAGAFRVLRGPRLSDTEGTLIEIMSTLKITRENQMTQGILEEIAKKHPDINARLPKDRMKSYMVENAQPEEKGWWPWNKIFGV